MQSTPLKILDVVALLEDRPDMGLAAGQVGTVVELLAPDAFEVEFLNSNGRTVAVEEFKRHQLLALRHPVAAQA